MKYKFYYKGHFGTPSEDIEIAEFSNTEAAIEHAKSLDKDGRVVYWKFDHSDLHNTFTLHNNTPKWKEKLEDFMLNMSIYIIDPVVGFFDKIKYAFQRAFRGYDDTRVWRLDSNIYDMLRAMLPKFIKNLHGCPQEYLDAAEKLIGSDKYHENKMNIAMALYTNDLTDLLRLVRLYKYYNNWGDQDIDSDDYVSPSEFPIPYLERSKEVDLDKLDKLIEETRVKIFEYLKEKSYILND